MTDAIRSSSLFQGIILASGLVFARCFSNHTFRSGISSMKDMRINGQRKLCPHPSSKPPLHSTAKKKIPRHEDRSLSDQMTHYLGPRISAIREQSSHFPIVSLLGIFAA